MNEQLVVQFVELVLGLLLNASVCLVLYRWWATWRQVKWYVIVLTTGNCLELVFALGVSLALILTDGFWLGSGLSCKTLMFMTSLGPSLANMAAAALAVHVLLTSMAGNQGSRLRHAVLITFFVLLSLPVPATKIPVYDTVRGVPVWTEEEHKVCAHWHFFSSRHVARVYDTAAVGAVYFLPAVILMAVCAAAVTVKCRSGRGQRTWADTSRSDSVLAGLIGTVTVICCCPYGVFHVLSIFASEPDEGSTLETYMEYMLFARPAFSASICVVSGCVCARKNSAHVPVGSDSETTGSPQTSRLAKL